ncbi:MAG: hypothetical protein OXF00_08095 [bacterium]|nr:hypothetical protein [bacterium]
MNELSEEWLAEKLAAYEKWADEVKPEDLKPLPFEAMGDIAKWINQFDHVNEAMAEAIGDALSRGFTWSQIGDLLGVSEQSARDKYSSYIPAQIPSWNQEPQPGVSRGQ